MFYAILCLFNNLFIQSLDIFNFGISIKKKLFKKNWTQAVYNNIKPFVILNGIASEYIFQNNKDIRGMTINWEEYKSSQCCWRIKIDNILRVALVHGWFSENSTTLLAYLVSRFILFELEWNGLEVKKKVFHYSRWMLDWKNPTFEMIIIKI